MNHENLLTWRLTSVLYVLGVLIVLNILVVHIVLIEKKEESGRKPD